MKGSEEESLIEENDPNQVKEISGVDALFYSLLERHKKGILPLNILFIVSVYNFLFFESEEGKEIYVLLPLMAGLLAYTSNYWETENKIRRYFGIVITDLGLLWDFFLSIIFIPNIRDATFDLESIPTLLLDLTGITIMSVWVFNRKLYQKEMKEALETLKLEQVEEGLNGS